LDRDPLEEAKVVTKIALKQNTDIEMGDAMSEEKAKADCFKRSLGFMKR
jgi:hypothetical protein